MLDGPAGAGKTELAQSVARASGAELLRLQCYQGINKEKAIGQYDKSLQELFVLLKTKADGVHDWDQIRRDATRRAFFLAGPLLRASSRRSVVSCSSTRSTRRLRPCCWSFFSLDHLDSEDGDRKSDHHSFRLHDFKSGATAWKSSPPTQFLPHCRAPYG